MNLIDFGRYECLRLIFEAYKKTGVPLIVSKGSGLLCFNSNDDIGIYILIPKLATLFNLSLDSAVQLFFYTILIGSFFSGLLALLLLFKTIFSRFVSIAGLLLLFFFTLCIGSTHIFYVTAIVGLVAWWLYWITTSSKLGTIFLSIMSGVILGIYYYLRSFCWAPVIIFIGIIIAATKKSIISKSMIISLLFASFFIPSRYFNYQLTLQKNYAQNVLHQKPDTFQRHVFWHTVYCGLGFIKFMNDDIDWSDDCAAQKVASINPNTCNVDEYENILKNEIMNISYKKPFFIAMTIFAKLGVLLLYFLLFANIGLIAAWLAPKPLFIECAFLCSVVVSSIFPIVALPIPTYSMSFIALATVYGMVSINYYLCSKV